MPLFKSNQKSFCASFITKIVSSVLIAEPYYSCDVNEKEHSMILKIRVQFTAWHEKRQLFICKQRKVIDKLNAYDFTFQQVNTNHFYVIRQQRLLNRMFF